MKINHRIICLLAAIGIVEGGQVILESSLTNNYWVIRFTDFTNPREALVFLVSVWVIRILALELARTDLSRPWKNVAFWIISLIWISAVIVPTRWLVNQGNHATRDQIVALICMNALLWLVGSKLNQRRDAPPPASQLQPQPQPQPQPQSEPVKAITLYTVHDLKLDDFPDDETVEG